jgi:DNA-binding transcriptional LysR family regulator
VLERTLGVKLFERSREGARLTREGSQILEPVRSFLDHAYRLETTVMDVRQGRGAGIAFGGSIRRCSTSCRTCWAPRDASIRRSH